MRFLMANSLGAQHTARLRDDLVVCQTSVYGV